MLDLLPNILIAAAGHADPAGEPAKVVHSLMHGPLLVLTQVGVGVLVLGILLCLYRMIKGPHLADRVLAADTVAMLVAGLVVILAIKYDTALFYDAALVVAILGFVSTVAFAQYMGATNKSASGMAPDPNAPTEEDAT